MRFIRVLMVMVVGVAGASVFAQGASGLTTKPPQERMSLPSDGFAAGAVASDTPGLVKPVEKHTIDPHYTLAAQRAKIQGTVVIELIVGIDGTVTSARVYKSLDKRNGLDDQALLAVKKYTFEPGTISGKPVPVYLRLDMTFRLWIGMRPPELDALKLHGR